MKTRWAEWRAAGHTRTPERRQERVLLMVTSAQSLILVEGLAKSLGQRGMHVHTAANLSSDHPVVVDGDVHHLEMERDINLRADLRALFSAWRLIRSIRPDLVIAGTPKAGLLGMIAAAANRVSARVYIVHGLRLETAMGIRRTILMVAERLACYFADHVVAVSPSLRRRLIGLGIVKPRKVGVITSATGVDLNHFNIEVVPVTVAQLSWPVLTFIGRMNADKGLELLARALRELANWGIIGSLLVVGGDDDRESHRLRRHLDESGWDVRHIGQVADVAPYLALSNILCLPSRREGFGTVVIEAAAMGVPTVAMRVTGLVDAIVDGETGILVEDGDSLGYASALRHLSQTPELVSRMGEAAQARAVSEFASEIVLERWADYFVRLVRNGVEMEVGDGPDQI